MHFQNFLLMFAIVNQIRRSTFSTCLAPFGGDLSVTQIGTLSYISHMQGQDVFQRDIEATFKIRRSTVSSLLLNLEKKGLLIRVPVSHDARLKKLVLTSAGRAICDAVAKFWCNTEEAMLRDLSDEEITQLHAMLEKIQKNLDAVQL